MLREPGSRALSQFTMHAYNHGESLHPNAFHAKITQEIRHFENCKANYTVQECIFGSNLKLKVKGVYIIPCLYSIFIEKWMGAIPKENLLFIKFERYREDPLKYLGNIVLPFLNLEPFDNGALELFKNLPHASNSRHANVTMQQRTRRLIDEFTKPYNEKLVSILGKEFEW